MDKVQIELAEKVIHQAKRVFIKDENLHKMGLTPLHLGKLRINGSKFFALKRLVSDIDSQDGFKYLYIPNNFGIIDIVGLKFIEVKNGGIKVQYKFCKSFSGNNN